MSNIGGFLSKGSEILDLEQELDALKSFAAVAERWSEIVALLPRLGSPLDFLKKLDEETEKDDVQQVLSDLNLDDEYQQLKDQREKITKLINDAGITNPGSLLERLAAFETNDKLPRLVKWSLIDQDPAQIADDDSEKLDYGLDLGGSAAIEIEANDDWPYTSDGDIAELLRMGASGTLEAKGDFKLPFSFGSISASTKADGKVALNYYFAPVDKTPYLARAVADRILHLPNPLDLNSVRRAYAASADFLGFDMHKSGSITANVEVGVGQAVQLANVGKLGVEAFVKAAIVRERDFQISLRRLNSAQPSDPEMRLVVSGSKSEKDEFGVGLKVVLEISELTKFLHKQLEPVVDEWDDVLAKIKPYLTPGTWLRKRANSELVKLANDLVKDDAIAAAIEADIGLLLGTSETNETAVGDFFANQLETAINGRVSSLLGNAKAEAKELVKELEERLPFFAQIDRDDAVETGIEDMVKKLGTAFKTRVSNLTNSQDERDSIAGTLAKAGIQVDAIVSDADAMAAEIRKFITEFDTVVKGALEELKKAANQKITLSFAYSVMKTDESTIDVKVDLDGDTSADDFQTLISGDFSGIADLIASRRLAFAKGTNIERVVEHKRSYASELIAFGLNASSSSVFSGKAAITLDHRGIVSVSTKAAANDVSTTLFGKEKTEASFFDVITLSRAKEAEQGNGDGVVLKQSIDIGLNLRRTDTVNGLKKGEIKKLVKDLTKFQLLSKEGGGQARETVNRWIGAGGKRSVPAIIDVSMPLTSAHVMKIVNLGNPQGSDLDARRSRILMKAERAIMDVLVRDGKTKDWRVKRDRENALRSAAKGLNLEGSSEATITLALALEDMDDSEAQRFAIYKGLRVYQAELEAFNKRLRHAFKLVELTEELYRVYLSLPGSVASPGAWDIHHFAAAQRSIADKSEPWLATGEWLFGAGTDGVDERMASLFVALGRIIGMTEPQIKDAITLKIQHAEDSDKVIVVR